MKTFERLVDASRKDPDTARPRVRVAIFDTGLDLLHRDIRKAREQGRLNFRDFVENSDDIKDEDGHGTHCTSLVLKYAPNAEVFAGRVFRKSQADGDSCCILTKVRPANFLRKYARITFAGHSPRC
jgi:subtilisin family serine protease